MAKYFVVTNKSDDFGNCTTELVHTNLVNAKQYFSYRLASKSEVAILRKFLPFVGEKQEKQRTDEERFYGN